MYINNNNIDNINIINKAFILKIKIINERVKNISLSEKPNNDKIEAHIQLSILDNTLSSISIFIHLTICVIKKVINTIIEVK